MADRDLTEPDADRVMEAFELFRAATRRQMRPADLGTIHEAARRKRRWRGLRVAVIATLLVLLPSGIGLSLAEASSHRASPAPTATAAPNVTATASPAPSPSGATNLVPQDARPCGDWSVALIAGSAGSGTWRALIGFTNISIAPCTISGYPTVVALGQTGATVTGQPNPTSALVSPQYPAGASFTLAAGETAGAEISGTQIDARGQKCPTYEWLRVTPPGGLFNWEISSFIPDPGQYAALCGAFTVSPLYPRAAFHYTPRDVISPTSSSPATAPCRASQLSAHQTYEISTMQQPLTIIALYNVSATACYLNGYVSIDAAAVGNQAVPISVDHSGNFERPNDPGPSRVDIPPGGAASFAIGTGLASDGGAHIITLTRLTLTPPGSGDQLQVATTIGDTRLNNTGPYPLSETALVAGTNGPNP